jgi:spermidine/putrescine transport system substrate-binding protein
MQHKRKYFVLLGLFFVLAVLMTACKKEKSESLSIVEWSGYELPEFWGDFAEKHPDADVQWTFMGESAEVYAQLDSGEKIDLIHPCNQYWKLLVDEELVQPIDTSKLSNWSGMSKPLTEQGVFNGKQYWVPWDWGFVAIIVRSDLVEKVPTSWADLWDPQYAGHIAVNDGGEAMHVITALALGLDPWNTTSAEDEAIKQKMMELVPNVLVYWSDATELNQLVASGDVWVGANAWNETYLALLDEGVDVEYVTPDEGPLGYVCGLGIPTTSQSPDLAHEMIDAYLAVDSMVYLAEEYGYGVANGDAIEHINPETAKLLGLDDPEVVAGLILYEPVTAEIREFWINEWSEVKASQ